MKRSSGPAYGVLGGTFDPPHVGHLLLAEWAKEELRLDRVIWVPAGDPWRKWNTGVTPAKQRVAMVRRAIARNRSFRVSTLEVERHGPAYAVDTLAALRRENPNRGVIFILGLDALRDLPNWRQPRRLISMAELAVAARGRQRLSAAELERLLPGLSHRVVWLSMPRVDISATDLRRRASEGRSLRYLVPDSVEEYIRRHGLYAAAP